MLSLRPPASFVPSRPPASSRPVFMTETTGSLIAKMRQGVNLEVDLALMGVCESLQLPEAARATAEKAYGSIAKFLMAEVRSLPDRAAEAYPQGSILQKTTVKPLKRELFDVDVVMELPWEPRDPVKFLEETHQVVLSWVSLDGKDFGAKSADKRARCIEVGFADQVFSMDVVPACSAREPQRPTRIKIVDSDLSGWKSSDPRAFARWFESRTVVQEHIVKEAAFAKAGRTGVVHPMPEDEGAVTKAPLRLAIQLAKRARDVFHQRNPKDAGHEIPSILLTVIVASRYRGTGNLAATLRDAAADIAAFADQDNPPRLENPANEGETITDKWERSPESWPSFRRWAQAFLAEVDTVLGAQDVQSLRQALSKTFGDAVVAEAVRKTAKGVGQLLDQGRLSVSSTGKVLIPGTPSAVSAVLARPTTYFGA